MSSSSEKSRQSDWWQVARAGTVSVITTATDVVTLVVLIELVAVHVTLAAFLAALTGAVTKFVLGKTWAFRDGSRTSVRQLALYAAMVAGSLVLVPSFMHLFVTALGIPYLIAKLMSGVGAFFLWSYPMQARLVFAVRGN